MRIERATKEDAPRIAEVVIMAVGDEIARNFAGERHTAEDVHRTFTNLCRRDDSQYSYRNTIKAVADDGRTAGYLVAYDGGDLPRLREAFIEEASKELGHTFEGELPDETIPGEYYMDSLAVFPEFRGQGIAQKLIAVAVEEGRSKGLIPGMLADSDNPRALGLYLSMGFEKVGDTLFAGVMMNHLQLPAGKSLHKC